MNRKKNWSLLVMAQSPRPTICRSSKLFPTTRFTNENGTETEVVPSDTVIFCGVPATAGFPAVMPNGPNFCNAATALFPGKAAASALIPAGVGVKLDEVAELCALCSSCWYAPKNHMRFFRIGPPKLPPNRLSTKRGITALLQLEANGVFVPAATPAGQNPSSGFFCPFCSERSQFPS